MDIQQNPIRLPYDEELFYLLQEWQKARFKKQLSNGCETPWEEELAAISLAEWLLKKIGLENIEDYFSYTYKEAEREVNDKKAKEQLERAKQREAEPWKYRKNLTPRKRKRIFERDGYRCLECGGYKNLCIDHIKPLREGGTDEESNLRTLCTKCNMKRIRHPLTIDLPAPTKELPQ